MNAQDRAAPSGDTRCRSLIELLHVRARTQPDKPAYQFLVDGDQPDRCVTYAELRDRCTRLAGHLSKCSSPGERALLLYPPGIDFVVGFLSCLQTGVIAVPLPSPDKTRAHRSLPRLRSVIRDADASLVLTTRDVQSQIEGQLNAESLSEVAGDLRRLQWLNTPEIVRDGGPPAEAEPATVQPEDVAFLQYTSGSTSEPKGVMVSHGSLMHQCHVLAGASEYTDASVTLTWMPYHHDYGLIEGLLVPLSVGATCCILSPVSFIRRPMRWLQAISDYRVTHSQAPNFAYDLCVTRTKPDRRTRLDLSSWKVAAVGAEPVRAATLSAFHAAFEDCGLQWSSLSPAYGLAETTLVVSHNRPGDNPQILCVEPDAWDRGELVVDHSGNGLQIVGCGRVLDDMCVTIVDPQTRRPRADREVGEIWVSGPSVTRGYWQRLDETAETFQASIADSDDGPFLRTGDLGCVHNGELFVCGRAKDLIIIRGLNHYPQDIELTVQNSHPALRPDHGAACSIDVDNEEQLVVVHEIVGKHRRKLDAEEVLSAIRSAVLDAHDIRVHAIALVGSDSVQKTTSGKIQRTAMKQAFLEGDLDVLAAWTAGTSRSPETSANAADIAEWLTDWMNSHEDTYVDDVDSDAAFADCGLDSVLAHELAADLEAWLGRSVDATVFFSHSTISALADHLGRSASVSLARTSETLALRNTGTTTGNLQQPGSPGASPSRGNDFDTEGIAIVGIGCRFPGGVDTPDAFWQLLQSGTDAITEIPAARWDVDHFYDADRTQPGRMYVRHGGFIECVDEFDPAFFGITPRTAAELDPQQRLLLEVVWESLEHAGIPPETLRETDTGVFVGVSSDDFALLSRNGDGQSPVDAQAALGTARSMAAGRVAYALGVHGPVAQIDTACSSSLMAVHQACQSLLTGECSVALAGGVNLMLAPETTIALCELNALAPNGRCKAFDAAADGTVRGEGCGMIVLKRASDAVGDGDPILSRIRATAANHDGASNGLTAPNPIAQEKLIRSALTKTGLAGPEITYVEAHGTGTELGDPIELNALHTTYGQQRAEDQPLYVGTAKTNIGHLEAAAGIAGLIKTVLVLRHGEIPASLNHATPTPRFDWQRAELQVPTETVAWPSQQPRLAAVSSFGCSGTNTHAILEVDRVEHKPDDSLPTNDTHLLALSAKSRPALEALVRRYCRHISDHPEQSLRDICFTAATGRNMSAHRLAVVATSRDGLLSELNAWLTDGAAAQVVTGKGKRLIKNVAFLFTGQGSQYAGMGRELYAAQPVFRDALDRCTSESELLLDVLIGDDDGSAELLNQTEYTQPALFAVEYALAELWKSWGVTPTGVLGHSIGEYAAACLADVFDADAGMKLVARRGELFAALPPTGTMAVVMASEAQVSAEIDGHRVSIAAINGPSDVTISGVREDVQAVTARLQADGFDTDALNTSNAGHSPLMDPVLDSFRDAAAELEFRSPRIPLVSNVSGSLVNGEVTDADYWARHIRMPVRFADGMRTLASTDCDAFLEIGPDPSLLAMGMESLADRKRWRWLPSLKRGRPDSETILYSLAELFVGGFNVNWQGFYAPWPCRRVSLPTYPFERTQFPLPGHRDATAPSNQPEASARDLGRQRSGLRTNNPDRATVQGNREPSEPRSLADASGCPSEPACQAGTGRRLPSPESVATQLTSHRSGLEAGAHELTPQLNSIAIEFVVEALTELGFDWRAGNHFSDVEFAKEIAETSLVKSNRALGRLVECGSLERKVDGFRVLQDVSSGRAAERLDQLNRESPSPEGELLSRAGPQLAAIWRGDVEPLTVLFPDGDTDSAFDFYSNACLLAGYNRLAGAALATALNNLSGDASLRILEVGAGTGGLTAHLLPQLPSDRSEYVFTDVSPHFLHAAADRFSEYPFLKTGLLDISRPIEGQEIESGTYDIVVAANVLHATPRLHETLAHVRSLLRPGGWLLLLECARPPLWGDTVFTLIDGWWNFEDFNLRPDYPLMEPDRWVRTLQACGFAQTACVNDSEAGDNSSHTLYLAQAGDTPVPSEHQESASPDETPESVTIRTLPDGMTSSTLRDAIRSQAAEVMRMRADEIDDNEPLANLGMDSLMAVELRTSLEQTLGVELSLNPLRMRRSVEEIAAGAFEDSAALDLPTDETGESLANEQLNTPRAHVVPLTPGKRSLPPLFFIPAGYGDLVAFQEIASALGHDQPVFGLRPASARKVKTIRQMSIYRMVSAYMQEIRNVQPHGPYHLTGYSAGAFIALELARELQRQGEDVALLVLIDPPSKVPFWLDWFYVCLYRFFKSTRLLGIIRPVKSRWVRRLFHAVLDEGLRTHTTVVSGHRVEPYDGHVTYFRSRLSQAGLVSMRPVGRFWRRIANGGLEEHWIPGTHYGMMRKAGAKVIVDELSDCLQRARSAAEAQRRTTE